MKLSELYMNKDAYDEIMTVLTKHQCLPRVLQAMSAIEPVIKKCEHYEKWRIDLPEWNGFLDRGIISVCTIDAIGDIYKFPNNYAGMEGLKLTDPQDLLLIRFDKWEIMSSTFNPSIKLLVETYNTLKAECPPSYEDATRWSLYYKPQDAAKAYESCMRLYKEYREKYEAHMRERRIKALEKEIAEIKGE